MQPTIYSVMQVKPRIWGTLTWEKSTQSAKQSFDRVCKRICKTNNIHLVVDMHEGIQMRRYKETGVKRPDFHFVLGTPDNVSTEELIFWLEMEVLKEETGYINQFSVYDESRSDISYCFDKHPDFYSEVYCSHKTKCRKRGCKYKKQESRLRLIRQ
jgi:hypothetical protein